MPYLTYLPGDRVRTHMPRLYSTDGPAPRSRKGTVVSDPHGSCPSTHVTVRLDGSRGPAYYWLGYLFPATTA